MQSHLPLTRRKISLAIAAMLSLMFLTLPVQLLADDYLDSLEAEADTTTVLKQAKEEHEKLKRLVVRTPVKSAPVASKKIEAANNTGSDNSPTPVVNDKMRKEFEEGLYHEFPGNYAVYTGLENEDKDKVVAAYLQASNKKGLTRYGPSLTLILQIASQ